MSSWSYYNEIDEYAAAWLRNLIRAGYIAPGEVDTRSIEDVRPEDLRGFTQCHFFAGIGVWSFALRKAGWADTRPVWTGSCPCQPFSAAGKGSGFDDERHLWPAFHHLIKECKPAIVLGEQVASKDADPWIDLVQADVEALGYGFGAIPFPSASVGAPHIRDRLYWVADSASSGPQRGESTRQRTGSQRQAAERIGSADGLANLHSNGCNQAGQCVTQAGSDGSAGDCAACGVADTESTGSPHRRSREIQPVASESGREPSGLADSELQQRPHREPGFSAEHDATGRIEGAAAIAGLRGDLRTGPVNGFWRDADWLLCRDGKWRPVEPGTFPLAHGPARDMGRSRTDWHTPAGKEGFGHRVGRLKGYGNAINAEAARVFIECVAESL